MMRSLVVIGVGEKKANRQEQDVGALGRFPDGQIEAVRELAQQKNVNLPVQNVNWHHKKRESPIRKRESPSSKRELAPQKRESPIRKRESPIRTTVVWAA